MPLREYLRTAGFLGRREWYGCACSALCRLNKVSRVSVGVEIVFNPYQKGRLPVEHLLKATPNLTDPTIYNHGH